MAFLPPKAKGLDSAAGKDMPHPVSVLEDGADALIANCASIARPGSLLTRSWRNWRIH